MTRLFPVCSTLVFVFGVTDLHSCAGDDENSPIDLGDRRELFVDRHLIEQMIGDVHFQLHHPTLQPPTGNSQPANPWGNVFAEGGLFKMLVRGYKDPHVSWKTHALDEHFLNHILLYYESNDGIHWMAEDQGLFDVPSQPSGNVVMADEFGVEQTFAAFRDTRPDIPESETYKGLGGKAYPGDMLESLTETYGPPGLRAYVSPDAIHWRRLQDQPVIPGNWGKFDSQNVVFWSDRDGCYVCYFRVFDNAYARGLRSVRRTTSENFIHWSDPEDVEINLPGEELYTTNIEPYFRAPHIDVGVPTRFMKDRGASTDLLFVSSRDGLHFDRTAKEAFIRPGLDQAAWQNRANYAAYHVIPTSNQELSIYVSGGRRYTLRTDGFMSLQAGYEGGEVVTRPFVFSGEQLEINYATSAAGVLRVEIQDSTGQPIRGFSLTQCRPIIGDRIEHTVEWEETGADDLAGLIGQPVRLRFVMEDADLYSFRFRNANVNR